MASTRSPSGVVDRECVVLLRSLTPCVCSSRLTALDIAEVELFARRAASENDPASTMRVNHRSWSRLDGKGGIDMESTLLWRSTGYNQIQIAAINGHRRQSDGTDVHRSSFAPASAESCQATLPEKSNG